MIRSHFGSSQGLRSVASVTLQMRVPMFIALFMAAAVASTPDALRIVSWADEQDAKNAAHPAGPIAQPWRHAITHTRSKVNQRERYLNKIKAGVIDSAGRYIRTPRTCAAAVAPQAVSSLAQDPIRKSSTAPVVQLMEVPELLTYPAACARA